MKKVVIFGLAANPPHRGHMEVAKTLKEYCDEVWLSPCYSHMYDKEMAEPAHRLNMCQLAVAETPGIKVCPLEIDSRWTLSTYEFMLKLRELFPDVEFSFCIGQDNADAIDRWKHHEKFIAEFPFLVIPRMSIETANYSWAKADWYKRPPHKLLSDFGMIGISSTDIRNNLEAYKKELHPEVYKYIQKMHLYEVHN